MPLWDATAADTHSSAESNADASQRALNPPVEFLDALCKAKVRGRTAVGKAAAYSATGAAIDSPHGS